MKTINISNHIGQLVITAPTCKIGHQVLERVLESGEYIRVIARGPQRIPEAIRKQVEVIQGSHADREIVNCAFEGADAVFWLVPADKNAESVYDAYVQFSIPAADALIRYSLVDMDIAGADGIFNALQRTPENTAPTSFHHWAETVLKPAFDARKELENPNS
jgi:uncharacterized protein YbjT (DUF2867 family)